MITTDYSQFYPGDRIKYVGKRSDKYIGYSGNVCTFKGLGKIGGFKIEEEVKTSLEYFGVWELVERPTKPSVSSAHSTSTKPVGLKFDSGSDKIRWYLVPWKQFEYVVQVLMYGETKYTQTLADGTTLSGADNWKLVDNKRNRYYSAAMRHLTKWFTGEKNDPETGLPHLAHCICCLLFLLWVDDNPEV